MPVYKELVPIVPVRISTMFSSVLVLLAAVALTIAGCANTQEEPGVSTQASSSVAYQESLPSLNVNLNVKQKEAVGDYTWEELAELAEGIAQAPSDEARRSIAITYHLSLPDGTLDGSQTKSIVMSNGDEVHAQIAGFAQDKTARDGNPAGITFLFVECIADHAMNSSDSNAGGWTSSEMRSWLNNTLVDELPADLTAVIKPVEKAANNENVGQGNTGRSVTTDTLWLPSLSELCGPVDWSYDPGLNEYYGQEGAQYQLFSDQGIDAVHPRGSVLERYYIPIVDSSDWYEPGSAINWWTRSPNVGSTSFFRVDSAGNARSAASEGRAGNPRGVVPGFCL